MKYFLRSSLFAALLFLICGSLVVGREARGYSLQGILSGSMEPALPVGSLVITRQEERYEIGDIVTYALPGNRDELITHRVVGNDRQPARTYLVTKGDANPNGDRWRVPSDQVVGRVVAWVPWVGSVHAWSRSPRGFGAIAVVSGAVLIGWLSTQLGPRVHRLS
jgi:signal peptidase